jgi:hypothetical protein
MVMTHRPAAPSRRVDRDPIQIAPVKSAPVESADGPFCPLAQRSTEPSILIHKSMASGIRRFRLSYENRTLRSCCARSANLNGFRMKPQTGGARISGSATSSL